MPANLTPQYLKAEAEYKRAQTLQEKLEALRHMLATIPKHKGTEKLQADIKTKVRKAKETVESERKKGKKGVSYKIPREGAGQVTILGAPNVGKSQLLAALTSARPTVAPYPFTTHAPQPGMMPWNDVLVQLIDCPPITSDYLEGYLPGMIRAADASLLVLDLSCDEGLDGADESLGRLHDARIQLVTRPRSGSETDRLIEKKTLLVANKLDCPGAQRRLDLVRELFGDRFECMSISASNGTGIQQLRDRLYRFLDVIRIYTKAPGKQRDVKRPFTCRAGSTVLDLANLVHGDIAQGLKFARIWGSGVYDGQAVSRDHVLHDGDLLELHT